MAFHDGLTGLPNRLLLSERVHHAINAAKRSNHAGALLLLDLDDFKTLNDTFGHETGDILLKQVAERLISSVRKNDTVARLGGDEFVVLLDQIQEEDRTEAAKQVNILGEKILSAFRQPFRLKGQYNYYVTPSIGISLFGTKDETTDDILRRADLAMYQAKAAGRNTLRFFDPDMQAVVAARVALEADLRDALEKQEFTLHLQPQISCEGELIGAEALLRWEQPMRGLVPPVEFIPLAENTGLILPLGQWVLTSACSLLQSWATDPVLAKLTIAINVSALQLRNANFVEQVLDVVKQTGADPGKLKIELTESLLVDNIEDTIVKMQALKRHGLGIALDDFGTGYSSLSYLKRLPLDQLKIDQSFVRDLIHSKSDGAIAHSIISLGQSLGLSVIAEGVESEGQREFLHAHGCPAYQGFYFAEPMGIDEFEAFAKKAAGTSLLSADTFSS
jgi:diguanylate cyclase (GGDEF)-like protein